jgi:uncharacterized protein YlxW (UPF0749 family)
MQYERTERHRAEEDIVSLRKELEKEKANCMSLNANVDRLRALVDSIEKSKNELLQRL